MENRVEFDYPFGVRVKFQNIVQLIQLEWNNIDPEPFAIQGKRTMCIICDENENNKHCYYE